MRRAHFFSLPLDIKFLLSKLLETRPARLTTDSGTPYSYSGEIAVALLGSGCDATQERNVSVKVSFQGVIPILPTPFTAAGEIDEAGFANVVEAAIRGGAHGLAMFGMASEYYKLTEAEKKRLSALLIQQTNQRCPVVLSIVSHATRIAVSEAVAAVEAGADALMVLPPHFLAPSVEAILRHIRQIAASVPVPIIVQYAPLQTGRTIEAQIFARLKEEAPNIASVKVDLVPSGPTISSLYEQKVPTMVGYMGLHLPEDFCRGVAGVMPTVSVCAAFVELWRLLAEDPQRANEMHRQLLPQLNWMMQSVEFLIAAEKELLVRSGIIHSTHCREPAYALDAVQREELEAHASRLGLWFPKSG